MEYGSRYQSAFEDAKASPEYWLEDVRVSFLDTILRAMETKRFTRKELAERLGKSQAYVSKTLNAGTHKFTLKTMVEFSLALGLKLHINLEDHASTRIEPAKRKSRKRPATAAPVSWSALEPEMNETARHQSKDP